MGSRASIRFWSLIRGVAPYKTEEDDRNDSGVGRHQLGALLDGLAITSLTLAVPDLGGLPAWHSPRAVPT